MGIGNTAELRFGIPNYFYRLRRVDTPSSGFGDFLIGVKQRLGGVGGFDLAIAPAVSFPTGSQAWSSGGVNPQLEIPWQHEISKPWSISGTVGVFYLSDNGRRRAQGECQIEIERDIGKATDVFLEYQGFDGVGRANNSLQMGGGYKVKPNHRLDYFLVVGLSRAAPNIAIGVGYSFRLDRLFHSK